MQAVPCLCQELLLHGFPGLWKLPCSHGGHSSQRDKRQNNTCWGITSFPQGWEKPCSALGNVPECCSLSWQGRTQSPLTPSCSKAASNIEPISGKAEALPAQLAHEGGKCFVFPKAQSRQVSLELVRGSETKSGPLNSV